MICFIPDILTMCRVKSSIPNGSAPLNKTLPHDSSITLFGHSFISFIGTFPTLNPPLHLYFYINALIIENTLQTCITHPFRLSQSALIHNVHHYTLDLMTLLTITHIYFGSEAIAYRNRWGLRLVYKAHHDLPDPSGSLTIIYIFSGPLPPITSHNRQNPGLIHNVHHNAPDPSALLNCNTYLFQVRSPIANHNRQSAIVKRYAICEGAIW